MKVKLVQDSIIFISALTRAQLEEANRFCPNSTTLVAKDIDTKVATPICSIAYANEGSVGANGVVFDSVTDDGLMCKTLVASEGYDAHLSAEDKVKSVSETFATLILKMNALEEQIVTALEANTAKIEEAKTSVEVIAL